MPSRAISRPIAWKTHAKISIPTWSACNQIKQDQRLNLAIPITPYGSPDTCVSALLPSFSRFEARNEKDGAQQRSHPFVVHPSLYLYRSIYARDGPAPYTRPVMRTTLRFECVCTLAFYPTVLPYTLDNVCQSKSGLPSASYLRSSVFRIRPPTTK